MQKRTLIQLLINVLNKFDNERNTIFNKEKNTYLGFSNLNIVSRAFTLNNYLKTLNLQKGERVAIISENRVEWIITDIACYLSGFVTVPIYTSLSESSIKYILRDSGTRICFVSTKLQLEKIIKIQNELNELEKVITYNNVENCNTDKVICFDKIVDNEKKIDSKVLLKEMDKYNSTIDEDDLLSIIYTSGTTGIPKGVMLTHKNIYTNYIDYLKVLDVNSEDVFLSYLPYSHIYERSAGYYLPFFSGSQIYYAQSIDTIAVQMTEVRPTIIITVPRLLDKMYFKLLKNAGEMSNGFRKKILKYAVNLAKENIPKKSLKWKIADFLVYKKIRKRTGGRIKYFVSGGGALNKSIGEFFDNIGIVTLEGYGMTETSPVISVNLPSKNKYGTVGPPLDTVKVKLADDGEIMVKGELVMKGYYNNPEETSRTIVDGWLYTGDIGEIDIDGYIKITERKKSLFKTSGGKYIAPTHIEELLSQIPYIDQVIVVGNEKMYVTALFVPDLSELKELAKNLKIIYSNIKELIESELLIKKIQQDLSSVQKSLANYERIRKFTIIEVPFSIETGELTPSLKLKRKYIEDKYKMVIENMYHKI